MDIRSSQSGGPDQTEWSFTRKSRNSKAVWSIEQLSAEYDRVSKLFGHLVAFVRRLKGQSVPTHLDEPLESKTPEVKNTKPRRRGKQKA